MRKFTDEEVCSKDFQQEVINTFLAMRPFFDYMSEVLTSDLDGNSCGSTLVLNFNKINNEEARA